MSLLSALFLSSGAQTRSRRSPRRDGAILRDTLRFAQGERHLREAATRPECRYACWKMSPSEEQNLPAEGLLAVLSRS
jgi:hypothetical protein